MAKPHQAADVAVARTSHAILSHFTVHQATHPQRAIGFNPTQPGETALFDQLRGEGVIQQASPGLFWVDETRLAARQVAAATRVATASAVVGLLFAGVGLLQARRRRQIARRRAQAASLN
jgi:hypothetical protein